ncbi:phosphoglucosamine mutase [Skermania piniformis]|uniref:Phosphoglucosamine mutase n=1 Tax=Skermania pinensis TaxID=39122 RepID=A0ABX8S9U6_9ACTN|nr:phosphoglucosamine mutase [Skermania piniformis]QXQ14628.1 phosphoglucosamine mutase [Skermania piniformis]
MGRMFGTDGVRGLANANLGPELALQLAGAAAQELGRATGASSSPRPLAVIGRDPRASGEMLEAAVTAGLTASGVDVLSVGVLPTPAVAYLTAYYDACMGVMISASHNPMPDNGIKIFAAGGRKLDDATECRIEARVHAGEVRRPTGAGIGRVQVAVDPASRYLAHLVGVLPGRITGLTVVVDCAHGAASATAPAAYAAAGARVITINAEPDGLNINDGCGSTHLEQLQKAVVEHGADIGIAHDGDADRCLAVDAAGAVVDGDAIMAVLALALHDAGRLVDDTLVTTVMSNLGLRIAMREQGIAMVTTAVGDRYVLEELERGGYSLGGEQSGHVVIPAHSSTGDGILTALLVLGRMAETGRSLAELAGVMTQLPQVLINVPVADRAAAVRSARVAAAVHRVEQELGDTGRVLLRPSGTEQLVRVMIEAERVDVAERLARDLAAVVAAA